MGALQSELEVVTGERDSAQNHLSQLHNTLQECQEGEPHTNHKRAKRVIYTVKSFTAIQ